MATKIQPGRARLTIKIRTEDMSTDLSGCDMSEDAAMCIYRIAIGVKVPAVKADAVMRAIEAARNHIARGERNFDGLLDAIEIAAKGV